MDSPGHAAPKTVLTALAARVESVAVALTAALPAALGGGGGGGGGGGNFAAQAALSRQISLEAVAAPPATRMLCRFSPPEQIVFEERVDADGQSAHGMVEVTCSGPVLFKVKTVLDVRRCKVTPTLHLLDATDRSVTVQIDVIPKHLKEFLSDVKRTTQHFLFTQLPISEGDAAAARARLEAGETRKTVLDPLWARIESELGAQNCAPVDNKFFAVMAPAPASTPTPGTPTPGTPYAAASITAPAPPPSIFDAEAEALAWRRVFARVANACHTSEKQGALVREVLRADISLRDASTALSTETETRELLTSLPKCSECSFFFTRAGAHLPVVLVACGHTLCDGCAKKVDTCPKCSKPHKKGGPAPPNEALLEAVESWLGASTRVRACGLKRLEEALQEENHDARLAVSIAGACAAPFLELRGVWAHAASLGLNAVSTVPVPKPLRLSPAPLLDCMFVAGPSLDEIVGPLRVPPKVNATVRVKPQLLALYPGPSERYCPAAEKLLANFCLPDDDCVGAAAGRCVFEPGPLPYEEDRMRRAWDEGREALFAPPGFARPGPSTHFFTIRSSVARAEIENDFGPRTKEKESPATRFCVCLTEWVPLSLDIAMGLEGVGGAPVTPKAAVLVYAPLVFCAVSRFGDRFAELSVRLRAAADQWRERAGSMLFDLAKNGFCRELLPPQMLSEKDEAAQRTHSDEPVLALAVIRGGIVSGGNQRFCVWSGENMHPSYCCGNVRGFAVLENGLIAAAGGGGEKAIEVWETGSPKCVFHLRGHTGDVRCVAARPGGFLVSGSDDKTVRIWDSATQRQVGGPLTGHTGAVLAVAVLHDGRIASGSADQSIRIWDVATQAETATPLEHSSCVNALAILDGNRLASGCGDNNVHIWYLGDRVEDRVRSCLSHPGKGAVLSLAVLPDGLLASGSTDRTVRVWDTSCASCVAVLSTPNVARALAVRSDGCLVSGDDGGTLRVWPLAPSLPWACRSCGHSNSPSTTVCAAAPCRSHFRAAGGDPCTDGRLKSGLTKLLVTAASSAIESAFFDGGAVLEHRLPPQVDSLMDSSIYDPPTMNALAARGLPTLLSRLQPSQLVETIAAALTDHSILFYADKTISLEELTGCTYALLSLLLPYKSPFYTVIYPLLPIESIGAPGAILGGWGGGCRPTAEQLASISQPWLVVELGAPSQLLVKSDPRPGSSPPSLPGGEALARELEPIMARARGAHAASSDMVAAIRDARALMGRFVKGLLEGKEAELRRRGGMRGLKALLPDELDSRPFWESFLGNNGVESYLEGAAVEALRREAEVKVASWGACVSTGAVPTVVSALNAHSGAAELCAVGCGVLGRLALSVGGAAACVEAGAVPAIVASLSTHAGVAAVCELGCRALASIATSDVGRAACASAVPAIINALRAHTRVAAVCEEGCAALRNIFGSAAGLAACESNDVDLAILPVLKAHRGVAAVEDKGRDALLAWCSISPGNLKGGAKPNLGHIIARLMGSQEAEQWEQGCQAILKIARADARACADAGAVPQLLAALERQADEAVVCKLACKALRIVAKRDCVGDVDAKKAVDLIVRALSSHRLDADLCAAACGALFKLAEGVQGPLCVAAVPCIVAALETHSKEDTVAAQLVSKWGCRALKSIAAAAPAPAASSLGLEACERARALPAIVGALSAHVNNASVCIAAFAALRCFARAVDSAGAGAGAGAGAAAGALAALAAHPSAANVCSVGLETLIAVHHASLDYILVSAAPAIVKSLTDHTGSKGNEGNADVCKWALKALHVLARGSEEGAESCLEAGAAPAIVAAIGFHHKLAQQGAQQDVCESGCWALAAITASQKGRESCAQAGAAAAVVSMMRHNSALATTESGCRALAQLAVNDKDAGAPFVDSRAAFALVSALKAHKGVADVCERACDALLIICDAGSDSVAACVAADAVPAIVSALSSNHGAALVCGSGCRALASLATSEAGAAACAKVGALPAILAVLANPSAAEVVRVSGFTALASTMRVVSGGGETARVEARAVPAIVAALRFRLGEAVVCEAGCWALANAAGSEAGWVACFAEDAAAVRVIMDVLDFPNHANEKAVALQGCYALASLAVPAESAAVRLADAVPVILNALTNNAAEPRVCEWGCKALRGVASGGKQGAEICGKANAALAIVRVLADHAGAEDVVVAGCEALSAIATHCEPRALQAVPRALKNALATLGGSLPACEAAAKALWYLARDPAVREAIIKLGVVQHLKEAVRRHSGAWSTEKALELLEQVGLCALDARSFRPLTPPLISSTPPPQQKLPPVVACSACTLTQPHALTCTLCGTAMCAAPPGVEAPKPAAATAASAPQLPPAQPPPAAQNAGTGGGGGEAPPEPAARGGGGGGGGAEAKARVPKRAD
jgi:hypothetical protein